MLSRFWRWLKGFIQRLFRRFSAQPVKEISTPPKTQIKPEPKTDQKWENIFFQLLDKVENGGNLGSVQGAMIGLGVDYNNLPSDFVL